MSTQMETPKLEGGRGRGRGSYQLEAPRGHFGSRSFGLLGRVEATVEVTRTMADQEEMDYIVQKAGKSVTNRSDDQEIGNIHRSTT
ncbi:hypothetical protein M0R45_002634 [Rubus argutus]|uniref:Uncharacterized protein n=1 Tax=Rubus argutus TaxID=59490 RepID=A0AAW1VMG6_RUBAR